MSRPPQLKSLKQEAVVRQRGECGGHVEAPAAEELEAGNGCPPAGGVRGPCRGPRSWKARRS